MRLLAAFACAVVLIPTLALAQLQPGSAGGTIGKTDKSISGGEEQGGPSQRPPRSASQSPNGGQTLPQLIRLNAMGTYSITLRHVGGNVYQGTWNGYPITSRMTVSMTPTSMTLQRQDTSNAIGPLYSGTYSGTRSGNTASGNFVHTDGVQGAWQASW